MYPRGQNLYPGGEYFHEGREYFQRGGGENIRTKNEMKFWAAGFWGEGNKFKGEGHKFKGRGRKFRGGETENSPY